MKDIESFEFNEEVTNVFDDMITRSVPFYKEIHALILDIFSKVPTGDELIYDLGCSTGTTIQLLHQSINHEGRPRFIGIDSSESMIKTCREKLSREKNLNFELINKKIQDRIETK